MGLLLVLILLLTVLLSQGRFIALLPLVPIGLILLGVGLMAALGLLRVPRWWAALGVCLVLVAAGGAGVPLALHLAQSTVAETEILRLPVPPGTQRLNLAVDVEVGTVALRAREGLGALMEVSITHYIPPLADHPDLDVSLRSTSRGTSADVVLSARSGPRGALGPPSHALAITVDLGYASNLSLRVGSGNLDIELPDGFTLGRLVTWSSEGNVILRLGDALFAPGAEVEMYTGLGGFDIGLRLATPSVAVLPFRATTGSGSIGLTLELGTSIGARVQATSGFGTVTFGGGFRPQGGTMVLGPSGTVPMTLDLHLMTGRGSIGVS
jgi:hypothetical protein